MSQRVGIVKYLSYIPIILFAVAFVFLLVHSNKQESVAYQESIVSEVKDIELGDKNAVLNAELYSSPDCISCSAFCQNVYPKLKKNYIDRGILKLKFEFCIDSPESLDAMKLVHSLPEQSDQSYSEDAVKILHSIYLHQKELLEKTETGEHRNFLSDLMHDLGYSREKTKDILNNINLSNLVAERYSKNEAIPIVPRLVINGNVYTGPLDADSVISFVENELKKAKR